MGSKISLCDDGTALFECPGCKILHGPKVGSGEGPRWGWNGSTDRPTFTPSILVRYHRHEPPVTVENLDQYQRQPWPQTRVEHVCHSFVTDGQIQFLGDSTHALAGQTVDLPDWED